MEIETINDSTYRSMTEPFQPGAPAIPPNGRPRAFGGHVYAQAVWAASHTVPKDSVVNAREPPVMMPATHITDDTCRVSPASSSCLARLPSLSYTT